MLLSLGNQGVDAGESPLDLNHQQASKVRRLQRQESSAQRNLSYILSFVSDHASSCRAPFPKERFHQERQPLEVLGEENPGILRPHAWFELGLPDQLGEGQ